MQIRASSMGAGAGLGIGGAFARIYNWWMEFATGIDFPAEYEEAVIVLCTAAAGIMGAALSPVTKE